MGMSIRKAVWDLVLADYAALEPVVERALTTLAARR